jgi:membrane protease YdiL (CAAX protease family)
MSPVTRIVRDHPFASFTFLACLFGWGVYVAAAFGLGTNPSNMPLGPVLAALVVASVQGRESLRAWGRRLRSWGASPKWYALAVLVPLSIHVVDTLVNHFLGTPLPTLAQLGDWTGLPATFVVYLVMVGIGEEAGWTAFAAPLLLRRHGIYGAWLLLSAVRIVWHLPLMINGEMPWVVGIVANAAFQMIVLQMFVASGGDWTPAAVWHATLNTFGAGFFFAMVTGADQYRLFLLLTLAYCLLAVVAVVLGRRRTRALGDVEDAVRGWAHDRGLQHQPHQR